jgi:methionyl aminopeptidase
MREAGKRLASVMNQVKAEAKTGVTTGELNDYAEELIAKKDSKPAFKNYKGFPAALCTSINQEIVHGVPSSRKIKDGDILSLDLGLVYNGFFSDMARTVAIGSASPEARRMIQTTKKSLKRAIGRTKPGKHLGDISHAVQNYIEDQGFYVVRQLCGHGIGKKLHEDPDIMNVGQRHKGPELKAGMVFAIEPMAAMGSAGIKRAKNGLCFETADGSLSAHFEDTVAITESGPIILTK